MTTKTNTNPWLMDVRVRERNLKAGSLTDKDLEKNLAALPDLEGHYDSFGTSQPALAQPERPAPVAIASAAADEGDDSDDDLGDEDEDEDDAEASKDDVVGGDEPAAGGEP